MMDVPKFNIAVEIWECQDLNWLTKVYRFDFTCSNMHRYRCHGFNLGQVIRWTVCSGCGGVPDMNERPLDQALSAPCPP